MLTPCDIYNVDLIFWELRLNKRKKIVSILIGGLLFFIVHGVIFSEELRDDEKFIENLLLTLERNQNVSESFTADLFVKSFAPHRLPLEASLKLYVKGQDKSLAKFVSPPRNKNNVILTVMNKYWIYFSNIRKSIIISPKQQLFGEVSNADVVKPPLIINYDCQLIGKEDENGRLIYVIKLLAKNKDTPYGEIIYHLRKRDTFVLYGEFYARSGVLLKKAFFSNPLYQEDRVFAQNVRIVDAVNSERYTIMEYNNIENKQLPDRMFTPIYLEQVE